MLLTTPPRMENILTKFELERNRALAEIDAELDRIESVLKNTEATEDDVKQCSKKVDLMSNLEKQLNGFIVNNRLSSTAFAVRMRMSKFKEERELKEEQERHAEIIAGPRGDFIREFETQLNHSVTHSDISKMAMEAAYEATKLSTIESLFMFKSRELMDGWYHMDEDSDMSSFADDIHDWVDNENKVVAILNLLVPNYS